MPLNLPTAEPASTSVIVTVPTASSMLRRTLPVAGSRTSRTLRLTASLSPTLTPAFDPTLMMRVPSGRGIGHQAVDRNGRRWEASPPWLANWRARSVTVFVTASPRIVSAKLLEAMLMPPPGFGPVYAAAGAQDAGAGPAALRFWR